MLRFMLNDAKWNNLYNIAHSTYYINRAISLARLTQNVL